MQRGSEARQRLALSRLDPRSILTLRLAAEADYRAGRSGEVLRLLAEARSRGDQLAVADGSERARIAVGKAIRRALARIAAADAAIGEELRACVRTGGQCCYQPAAA